MNTVLEAVDVVLTGGCENGLERNRVLVGIDGGGVE